MNRPAIWLSVFGLSAVLIIVLFTFISRTKSPSPPQKQNSPSNTTQLETSTWHTYTNSDYHFQLKYPPAWQIAYPSTGSAVFSIQSPQQELIHATPFTSSFTLPPESSTVKIFHLPNGVSLVINYVDCDGEGCGPGSLDLPAFSQILSTFRLQ
jgi:hypothetical protein